MNYVFINWYDEMDDRLMTALSRAEALAGQSQVVVLNYNRFFHRDLQQQKQWFSHVDQNMFDVLNQTRVKPDTPVTLADLRIMADEPTVRQDNVIYFFQNGRKLLVVTLFQNSKNDAELVDSVHYFDPFGNEISGDYYDVHGFKSMSVINGVNGGVAQEVMFDLSGHEKTIFFYQQVHDDVTNTMIQHYDEQITSFTSREQLVSYFCRQYGVKEHDTVLLPKSLNFLNGSLPTANVWQWDDQALRSLARDNAVLTWNELDQASLSKLLK